MISLRKVINRKEILENENPKKEINVVEELLDFNKQQKGKGIKILTPNQMLQRLPIASAQVKAGNTYIFCIEKKKLLKKYTTI